MKRIFIALCLVSIFIICAAVLYVLNLAFTEDLYFRKNGAAYYLFVDSFIENVPRPGILGEPEYYSSCGDGAKMPGDGVNYESLAPREEIFRQIDLYLAANGFQMAEMGGGFDYQYENGKYLIRLSIRSNDGVKRSVSFVRRY